MKNSTTLYKKRVPISYVISKLIALLGLLLAVTILSTPLHAQSHPWTVKTPNKFHKSAVISGNGATFVLGAFSGTVTVGNQTFTSQGGTDLLLVSYLSYGTVSWAVRIGGTGDEQPGDLAYSDDLGLYITGSFQSTAKLTDKSGTIKAQLTSAGGSDIFVARYDWYGKFYWARKAGGAGEDFGNGIHVDKASNVYLTGSFNGSTKFSTFFTMFEYSTTLTSLGNSDIFIAKYNKDGVFLLAGKTGGKGYDFGKAIATDPNTGDIYVTGGYSPATSLYTTNIVVAKFWSSGTIGWAKLAGMDTYVDQGNDIIATKEGVYVTGYFGGMATFDATTLSSSGPADAFVAFYKYSGAGKAAWAKRYGGGGWDEGQSLALHEQGIYLAGVFSGTATFGSESFTALGGAADRDLFLSSLSSSGTPAWTRRIGTSGQDLGNGGIAISNVEKASIFFTGNYATLLTLGSTTLSGPGTLLTRIDLPHLYEFKLVLADKDSYSDYGSSLSVDYNNYIDYRNTYTYNINFEAIPKFTYKPGPIGSVKFILDGVERIDNTYPYTWAGDEPKLSGGTDYKGFTPAEGTHKLEAIPYSGSNGTGIKGISKVIQFTIKNTPKITNLMLINADTDKEIKPIVKETSTYINYKETGTNLINIRADHDFIKVGSMKFVLNGEVRIENIAPFTWAGDEPKADGSTDYKPFSLAPGSYELVVTPYSQANASGTAGSSYTAKLYVSQDSYRIAAPNAEPQAKQAIFSVAPNPFAGRTTLAFTAAEGGPATVDVYNLQGILVQRLFDDTVESGKLYSWEFDGSTLPGGLYIGRVKVGHQVFQQKLVLSR